MDPAPLSTQLVSPPPPPGFAMMARGFSVGAVISRTFSVWWSNLFRFGLLGLLVYVPAIGAVGAMAMVVRPGGSGVPAALPLVVSAAILVSIFFTVVEMGAITYGAVDAIAGGKPGIGAMLRVGFRRAWPLFLAGVVLSLLVALGMLLLVVPGIILGCAAAVTIPACVAEGKGPIESLRRSFALTRGHRLELFGAFLVMMFATWLMAMLAQLLMVLFTASLGPRLGMIGTVPVLFVNSITYTLLTVLPAVGYHDLRVAKEGVVTADLLKVFE
jgi:hypothetical protein